MRERGARTDERVLAEVAAAWGPAVQRLLEPQVLDAAAARGLKEGLRVASSLMESDESAGA